MSRTAVAEGQLPKMLGGAPGTFWHMAEVSSLITSRDAVETLGSFTKERQFQGIAQACILHTPLCFKLFELLLFYLKILRHCTTSADTIKLFLKEVPGRLLGGKGQ